MNESDWEEPINKERRIAPRHRVNLQAPVLISAISNYAKDNEPYFVLRGRLCDVSLSGIAIIVSRKDRLELEQLGDAITLRLLLPLPVQAIELDAMPVRYQRLNEGEESDVLIGAQITNMNGRDRILFMDFIYEFETGSSQSR